MTISTRDLDRNHPYEKFLINQIGDEGVVIATHEIEWSGQIERQLVVVVPSENGPEIVCCRVWPAAWGDPIVKVSDPLPVYVACSRRIPPSLVRDLEDRFLDDKSIIDNIEGRPAKLWSSGISRDTAYLLRMTSEDGNKRVAFVTSHGETRGGSEPWEAKTHFDLDIAEFKAWADEEFGVAFKPR